MKRGDLIKAIESFGCHLVRHGGRHDWSAPHRQPARVVQLRCSSARQEEAPPGPAAEAPGADSGQGKGVPTPPHPTPRPSNQPLAGRRGNWVARFLVFVLMRNLDYDPVPGVVLPASAEPFVLVVVEVLKSVPTRPHRRPAASRIEWTNRVVTVLPKVPVTPRVSRRCEGSPAKAWQIRAWADLASFTIT